MKNFLLAIALLFLFVKPAFADQLQLLDEDDANRAVEALKKQKEILLFCGCCHDDNRTWLLMEDAWKEPESGSYEVHVKGRTIPGTRMSAAVDLAYVHINNNGMSQTLGEYLGMSCDPCIEPFEWKEGSRKYKQEDVAVTKKFYAAFDSVRAEVAAHPPLKMLNRIDMETWLKVSRADVQLDYKTGNIIFVYTLENNFTLCQYIPLVPGGEATSTGKGNCSVSPGQYSPFKAEQLLNGQSVYSSWTSFSIPLALGAEASPRIANWLNMLFRNYSNVGERK